MHGREWWLRHVERVVVCGLIVVSSALASGAAGQRATAPASAPCIALMMPEVKGLPGHSDDVGNGVRELFASYLTAPTFKTVMLEAKLPMLAVNEAREKGCANLLSVTLTGKQSGSSRLGKIAGQAAGTAAVYVPGGSNTGASIVRGAVAGSGYAISSLASATKVKDELKIEYRVETADKSVKIGPATQQAKAEVNGEDILTPIVQRAATQIAGALLK
jgi:hypothetical protein